MASATILVADGKREDFDAFRARLDREEFIAINAASGESALGILQVNPLFDVVLVSLSLIDVPAAEVCRRLQEDKQTAAIPIILMADPDISPEAVYQGIDAGAFGCVSKPIDLHALRAWIRAGKGRRAPAGGALPDCADTDLLKKFAKLSHNVNNPMQALYATADMLSFKLPEGSKERDLVENILKYAQRAGDIVAEAAQEAKRALGQ
jgi:DNA-binding response OmpR family regulator